MKDIEKKKIEESDLEIIKIELNEVLRAWKKELKELNEKILTDTKRSRYVYETKDAIVNFFIAKCNIIKNKEVCKTIERMCDDLEEVIGSDGENFIEYYLPWMFPYRKWEERKQDRQIKNEEKG